MENRALQQSIPTFMFEWKSGKRLITVILGIPMYRSSGRNSGFKDSWFPFLGINGKKWLRKPKLNLPTEILKYCKEIGLDKIFQLSRFGTIQTLCISASLGNGIWDTEEGKQLFLFLLPRYFLYFLNASEIAKIQEMQDSQQHLIINDVGRANFYLDQFGSHVPVDCYSRLPYSEEYYFFHNKNSKIHAALKMMLTSNRVISSNAFAMVTALSQNSKLMEYALINGIFETKKNVASLNAIIKSKKNITHDDLIAMNSLHNLQLPPEYEYFKNKYPCRRILRKLNGIVLNEAELKLMKKIDDLHLLGIYEKLLIDNKTRETLLRMDIQGNLHKTLKTCQNFYNNKKNLECNVDHCSGEHLGTNMSCNAKLLEKSGLFSNQNPAAKFEENISSLELKK